MKLILLSFFLITSPLLWAATKSWDGGAGTVNWEDANNWSGNTLPTAADSVIIKNAFVEISSVQTIQSLRIEDGPSAQLTINKNAILGVDGGAGIGVYLIKEAKLIIIGPLNIKNCYDGLVADKGTIILV